MTYKKTTKTKSAQKDKAAILDEVLDKIRPALERDGGNLELVDFDQKKGIVQIAFQGACVGCPLADVTLTHLIEAEIKASLPEVKEVRAV